MASGTGELTANAVYELLLGWKVNDQVIGMSFDTTSSNTGNQKGACTLLETKLDRHLLWLACRHHMLEIILSQVFKLCFGPSTSPDIPLFKRFRDVWENISRESYEGLDLNVVPKELVDHTLEIITKAVTAEKIRDDYHELMELTLIVLSKPPTKIHWRAPGPIHHARWMAKLLYAMKIFLFKKQKDIFNLTEEEEKQISRFAQFAFMLKHGFKLHWRLKRRIMTCSCGKISRHTKLLTLKLELQQERF